MDKDKLLSMLGLSKKAGKLLQGFESVTEAALAGKVRLILLTEDLAPRSGNHVQEVALEAGVRCLRIPVNMDDVGYKTGKRAGILGLTDAGFAKAVRKMIPETTV